MYGRFMTFSEFLGSLPTTISPRTVGDVWEDVVGIEEDAHDEDVAEMRRRLA
jgi:hypothetical protein